LIVVVGLALLGVTSWQLGRAMTTDQPRVLEAAGRILPGARPLPGQVGLFALDLAGAQIAVLGDPRRQGRSALQGTTDGSETATTFLMYRAGTDLTPQQLIGRLRREMEARRYRESGTRILQQEEVRFLLGTRPLSAAHLVVEAAGGQRLEEFTLVLRREPGHVIAMFLGPEDHLKAGHIQAFLDGLAEGP
jgi:hypothetical protein